MKSQGSRNLKILKYLVVAAVIIIFILWAKGYFSPAPPTDLSVMNFAKCLTANKVTMYGAYWCSHCKTQKEMFGPAFRFINYVECADEKDDSYMNPLCKSAGIKGFPTWTFADGSRLEGEIKFWQLEEKSGCKIE